MEKDKCVVCKTVIKPDAKRVQVHEGEVHEGDCSNMYKTITEDISLNIKLEDVQLL